MNDTDDSGRLIPAAGPQRPLVRFALIDDAQFPVYELRCPHWLVSTAIRRDAPAFVRAVELGRLAETWLRAGCGTCDTPPALRALVRAAGLQAAR